MQRRTGEDVRCGGGREVGVERKKAAEVAHIPQRFFPSATSVRLPVSSSSLPPGPFLSRIISTVYGRLCTHTTAWHCCCATPAADVFCARTTDFTAIALRCLTVSGNSPGLLPLSLV